MAGDTIQIGARAFYKSTGPANNSAATPDEMIASLLQAFGGNGSSDASHAARQAENLSPFRNFNNSDYQRLKEKDPDENREDKPKAYLNFALFDDQFNLVEDNSGVRQVKGDPDQLQTLAVDKMVVTRNGFLYVYTSNETPQDVFFDNLTVQDISGPLLEETHYYPFGLTMAGISSNALKGVNYPENRKKYNGIEFTTDLDLDIYDAQLRNLDPQIGRWNQIDPKIEDMEMWSPYASNYDNAIRYNDFLGDEPYGGPGFFQGVKDGFVGYYANIVDAVTHPVETLKSGFSVQNIALNAVDPLGVGRSAYNAADNVRTVVTEGAYGAGKVVGKTGAEVALVVATEGAGRAVSAIRGAGRAAETTAEAVAVEGTASTGKGTANPKVAEAANAGKRAHADFSKKAAAKGWTAEPNLTDPATGKTVRPDAVTPSGHPVELKPNTPSGRAKGARQLPKYVRATGNNGRVIYYDPTQYKKP
jgi:RHS repeat-associated protein